MSLLHKPLGSSYWRYIFLLIIPIFIIQLSPQVFGLSAEQQALFNSGIYYFDAAPVICGVGSTTLPAAIPEPYNSLFSQAAAALKTNPQFISAIFLDEHHNTWPNPAGPWATSKSAGAQGPFQFLPGTWDSYKIDGNNDGVIDIQNLADAAFTTANWAVKNGVTPTTILGDINQPFALDRTTLLYKAAAYNWGGGNIQQYTSPTTSITDGVIPLETKNYIKNTYELVSSGFTNGDKSDGVITNLIGVGGSANALALTNSGCSAGIVAGSVVQTALGLALPQPANTSINALIPTPAYASAIAQYYPNAPSNGADCGVFVGIVMRTSGADPDYPKVGTMAQQNYMQSHPDKYLFLTNLESTSDLQPGDILIVNANGGAGGDGHTMIYVGPQKGGYNEASASLGSRMPNLGNAPANLIDPPQPFGNNRGHYIVARLR